MSMLQRFSLHQMNHGLREVTAAENDLFWRTLASLKNLRSFKLDLQGGSIRSENARELLRTVTVLTQFRWVSRSPVIPSTHKALEGGELLAPGTQGVISPEGREL